MSAGIGREHPLGGGKTLRLAPDPMEPGVCGHLTMFGATVAVIPFTPEKINDLVADLLACLKESQS